MFQRRNDNLMLYNRNGMHIYVIYLRPTCMFGLPWRCRPSANTIHVNFNESDFNAVIIGVL